MLVMKLCDTQLCFHVEDAEHQKCLEVGSDATLMVFFWIVDFCVKDF